MTKPSIFTFKGYKEELSRGKLTFHYSVTHQGETINFAEIIELPAVTVTSLTAKRQRLIWLLLHDVHIVLGMSYWKLFCPSVITGVSLSQTQTTFWDTVYRKGMGEFFYKNHIDSRGLIEFPVESQTTRKPIDFQADSRSLVLLGGGKDSIVSAQLLKKANREFSLFVVNAKPVQTHIAQLINKPMVHIRRILDSKLFALNKRKDVYNGHVPISAIYAFLGVFAAALYDYRYVISSNEASASYGNTRYLGEEINHQWSKSWEFESLFGSYLDNTLTHTIKYFSLLRPFNEITISELFSTYPKYFTSISSCNTNFRLTGTIPSSRWCGTCAKCAFVFLMFAAFFSKEALLKIFHKNLFENETLIPLYEELMGISDVKPFECVGTPAESRLALRKIIDKKELADTIVIGALQNKLSISSDHMVLPGGHTDGIPDEFRSIIIV